MRKVGKGSDNCNVSCSREGSEGMDGGKEIRNDSTKLGQDIWPAHEVVVACSRHDKSRLRMVIGHAAYHASFSDSLRPGFSK